MKKLIIIIFLFSTVAIFAQVERPKTAIDDATIAAIGGAIADSANVSTSVAVPVTHVLPNQQASVTWTSENSLTISGFSHTFSTDCQVVYAQVLGVDSNYFYMQGISGINMTVSGNVLTITGSTNSVPFPRTASFSIGVNLPERAYNALLDVIEVIVKNAMELKVTSTELLYVFEDEAAGVQEAKVIGISSEGYTSADGSYCVYAGATDTVANYIDVTWDGVVWLNVSALMLDSTYLSTETSEYDTIPFTLQDIYDNGYGVPWKMRFRNVIDGGTDNKQTSSIVRKNEK